MTPMRRTKTVFSRFILMIVLPVPLLLWAANTPNHLSKNKNRPNTLPLVRDVPVLPDIVILKQDNTDLAKNAQPFFQSLLKKAGVQSIQLAFPAHENDGTEISKIHVLKLSPGSDVYHACEVMLNESSVVWAEPMYLDRPFYTTNDPMQGFQWYLDKVKARTAWNLRGANPVLIAIVDTGVDWQHPDLADNIWINPAEIANNGIDDDGNGYVDDIRGWDFADNDNNPAPLDDHVNTGRWHGTAVAGIAGAVTDNNVGIASLSFNAKLLAIKVSQDSDANQYILNGYQGIVYAADMGADIINASFGGSAASNVKREAVLYAHSKGTIIVAAASNENEEAPIYPADYPGVYSIAATNSDDQKSGFSNFGYTIDFAAPGSSMYTTTMQKTYSWWNGTSFSTPMAASAIALVLGSNPHWTARQAAEQVRVTCDNVDAVNPQYSQKLGTGRINGFRAMTETSPSIRLTDYEFREGANSNDDGIIDPGEEILATLFLTNYLQQATGIQVQITSSNENINILNGQFSVPALGTMDVWNNASNPVRIQIVADANRGQTVDLFINITAQGNYTDFDHMSFDISPMYGTIAGGRVRLTLTSTGRLGFVDYPQNQQGEGFQFGQDENMLFDGAFMAGVSANQISDVARSADQSVQNQDFTTALGGDLDISRPGPLADEQGFAAFTDEATANALNIQVIQTSLAFHDAPDDHYIILAYKIVSQLGNPINNLHIGLFADWDVGASGANSGVNQPGFAADLSIGYVYDPATSLYAGTMVLGEDAAHYKSIHNADDIYDGYTDTEKWGHLSGGIQDISKTTPADYSNFIGIGPKTLNAGDTLLVGFAMVAGASLDELRTGGVNALSKWNELIIGTSVNDINPNPLSFQLDANYPNPFNPSTIIGYTIADKCHVTLVVHDILGREIVKLVDKEQSPGKFQIQWDGLSNGLRAPSGVYFYRLQAGEFEQVRKMVMLQ